MRRPSKSRVFCINPQHVTLLGSVLKLFQTGLTRAASGFLVDFCAGQVSIWHKPRTEKDRRYALSAKGAARRRRYDHSLKGRARTRRWRKTLKGRRAIHQYNVSPRGQAKRERSLAKLRGGQRSGQTTPVPDLHRLNTATRPERNILKLSVSDFTGPNRGDVRGPR